MVIVHHKVPCSDTSGQKRVNFLYRNKEKIDLQSVLKNHILNKSFKRTDSTSTNKLRAYQNQSSSTVPTALRWLNKIILNVERVCLPRVIHVPIIMHLFFSKFPKGDKSIWHVLSKQKSVTIYNKVQFVNICKLHYFKLTNNSCIL